MILNKPISSFNTLPTWTKTDWRLPTKDKGIEFVPLGMMPVVGKFDGNWFLSGAVKFSREQIQTWRYLDERN